MVWYFAYGRNMDRAVMVSRKAPFSEESAAILKDYKLVFNKKRGDTPGGGYANVIDCAGSEVEGVAYKITEDGLRKLDVPEGCYPGNAQKSSYLREPHSITLGSGKVVEAEVYFATPQYIHEGLKPKKEYMYNLLVGALQHNLSEEYIRKLVAVEVVDNP